MKPLERKLALGFGAALIVLVLVTGGAAWDATRFRGAYGWMRQSYEAFIRLDQVLTEMLVMEASVRGYLLTGEDAALKPYETGRSNLEAGLQDLRRLSADNPRQLASLDRIDPLARRAREIMAERIALRRERGLEAVTPATGLAEGQRTLAEFRQVVREMAGEERRSLDARLKDAYRVGLVTIYAAIGASAVAAVFMIVAGLRVRRDLARREQAEAERDRVFTLSRDLLSISHLDGRFKRVNPAWQHALGYSSRELLGRPQLEIVHPDDRARIAAAFAELAAGGEEVDLEARLLCQDGTFRWLHWQARAVLPEQLVYASARDITDRKAADERIQILTTDLALRARQLEAANRELESFSYSVSHDLRAPLRHIDGFANLLVRRAAPHLDDESRRFLATISKSAKQMGVLIDDLLSFSRVGRTPLQLQPVDHNRMLAEVIADGRYEPPAHLIAWDLGTLPITPADPALLRQVWTNLIGNAVKYSGKNPAPRIAIAGAIDAAAQEYVFSVRDNGVGFDMAYADKLFGVFQRLHSPAEFEGTGIGLANVRRIVSRHGGRTWAIGRPGEGATFFFSIPLTASPAPASS